MTKGFFRERKHYSLQEITDNLININMEETRRIVGILKKYGVVKAVKKNRPDFDDLSNEDIVLTDVIDSSSDIEYIFDYVGVVVIEGQVFKCYPKYIKSTEHLFENLKQVLKVIKKYNASEQLIYLFNGEDDSKIFNRLAVSIHLLETYYADGLYTNQKEIIETNGEGEILWDKTINETFAIIQNNKPYYVELQTKNTIDNDYDYFRRLHECVLTQCSRELSDAGLLELFELTEVELTQEEMSDFGDASYILYRLQSEIQTQYITRKQNLLKTIYEIDVGNEYFPNTFSYKDGVYKAGVLREVVTLQTAKPLGTYLQDYNVNTPAITENAYGKGKAYYVAVQPDLEFLKEFLGDVIEEANVEANLTETLPYGVTVSKRSGKEQKDDVYFLQNFNRHPVKMVLNECYTNLITDEILTGSIILQTYQCIVMQKK